ncbi:MAG: DUF3369 domain-containing protein [Tissierellales bacterium]
MDIETEAMFFAEENPILQDKRAQETWKVIIADDEEGVHQITKMVLSDFELFGKKIDFISTFSGEETKRAIIENPDTALILLDVVMETDNAGLKVAKYIREELKNNLVRIVLRTGYPGQAPERKVIIDYDINDYKEKTELTSQKLFTTIVTALRSYKDILVIEENRRALEKLIESSPKIFELQSLGKFVSAVLSQMISIMNLSKNTIFYSTAGFAATRDLTTGDFKILAAAGNYINEVQKNIRDALKPNIISFVEKALTKKESILEEGRYIAYFRSKNGAENIIYTEINKELNPLDKNLINLFCNNVSIAFDNLYLNKEIEDTQKEIIYTLGEVTEGRSMDIGNHIKKVSKYCELLASKCGLPEEEVEVIKIASPIHDIGKIVVSDAILNKPGKLTPEEFEIIKEHSMTGYNLLKGSNRKILKVAAIIARDHHEKYDGTGYPRGLKGEEIHLYGRIACVADVFDALSSKRAYKEAWEISDILEYFKRERGGHFDPKLVDILIENMDEFLDIKAKSERV